MKTLSSLSLIRNSFNSESSEILNWENFDNKSQKFKHVDRWHYLTAVVELCQQVACPCGLSGFQNSRIHHHDKWFHVSIGDNPADTALAE